MYSKHKVKFLSIYILIITIVLGIYSIVATVQWYHYENEYDRVQGELVDLAIVNTKIEKELEDKEKTITDLRTKPIYTYKEYSIPAGHNSFRSWMPSSAISKSSKQGQYVAIASADEDGLLKINDCYCVALGTYYGELGDIFRVTTSTGNTFRVIKTDVKADQHTDSTNRYTTSNGCMMEFVVNKHTLNTSIKSNGCVNTDIISGDIIKIEKELLR